LIVTLYLLVYVYFVVAHARLKANDVKVIRWLVDFTTVVNMVVGGWLVVWLAVENAATTDFQEGKFSTTQIIVVRSSWVCGWVGAKS
jgi:hypothetical protein